MGGSKPAVATPAPLGRRDRGAPAPSERVENGREGLVGALAANRRLRSIETALLGEVLGATQVTERVLIAEARAAQNRANLGAVSVGAAVNRAASGGDAGLVPACSGPIASHASQTTTPALALAERLDLVEAALIELGKRVVALEAAMADCQACHRTRWRPDGTPCFDCIGGISSCCDGAVPLDTAGAPFPAGPAEKIEGRPPPRRYEAAKTGRACEPGRHPRAAGSTQNIKLTFHLDKSEIKSPRYYEGHIEDWVNTDRGGKMARAREEVAEILRLHGLGVAQAAIAQQLRLTKGIVAGVLFRARWGPELATADRAQPASPQLAIARAAAYHLAELERRLGWPAVMQTGCRFVIGDPREAWRWCGRRVVPGASWCAAHAAMLFDRKPRGEGAWEAQRVAWKKRGTDPNWW